MRKYQPIWEAIKENDEVSLTAPLKSHARIITAVRKEKTLDLAWKLILSEQRIRYKLKEIVEGTKITFTLELDTSSYVSDMIF